MKSRIRAVPQKGSRPPNSVYASQLPASPQCVVFARRKAAGALERHHFAMAALASDHRLAFLGTAALSTTFRLPNQRASVVRNHQLANSVFLLLAADEPSHRDPMNRKPSIELPNPFEVSVCDHDEASALGKATNHS